MPQGFTFHFPIKTAHTGTPREVLCAGSVRLNLSKFSLSVNCSVVTYHYCGRRVRMAIEYINNVIHIPLHTVSTIWHTMAGP